MSRHLSPIWSGSFAVLALILVLPAYGQNRTQKSAYAYGSKNGFSSQGAGQGGMQNMCGKSKGQVPFGQSGAMQNPFMQGGGMQNPFMQGGGMQNPFMQGGGMQNPFMQGGGMQNPFMQGGGMQNPFMQGGGMQNPFMQGGGMQNPIMQAGGIQNPLMQAGGFQAPIMQGSGTQTPLAQTSVRQNRILRISDGNKEMDTIPSQAFTQTLQNQVAAQLQAPIQDADTQAPKEEKKQPRRGAVQNGINQALRSIGAEQ